MVAIADKDLQQLSENYEDMVDALERYRATLLACQERYKANARDPSSYAGPLATNLKRVERMYILLDGEVFDALRLLLDGSGVLASVDEGRWI